MIVDLTPALTQRLENLAASMDQSANQVAEKAIGDYVLHMQNLIASVREADESAEREGTLTSEEVWERITKRFGTA